MLFTFFLSLIPAWSDEFENNHPIIHNNTEANSNQNPNNNNLNNNEENQINENQENPNIDGEGIIQEEAKGNLIFNY